STGYTGAAAMNATALTSAVETLARLDALAPADALVSIDAIITALPSCNAPDRLDALAAALPSRVGGYPAELALALAGLAFELVDHHPRPPEDLDALAPALQVAWLRVRLSIADDPAELAAIDDALLLRTLADWPHALLDAAAPIVLLDRMAGAVDPRLRALALQRIAAALQHVAITPAQACACLLQLARDRDPGLRRAALERLREHADQRLAPALAADRRALIAAGLDDAQLLELCTQLAVELGER